MSQLTRDNLMSLEEYAERRPQFRQHVIAHKKDRCVRLGENASLYFEDALTVQYQIQEMLRIEKIFEAREIAAELETYNPLIPDGRNLKATFMLEYPDVKQRQEMLSRLIGVEQKVWIKVGAGKKVYPIANEDLERATEHKTSSVHFLRFELTSEMINQAKAGADIAIGVEHPYYEAYADCLSDSTRNSLVRDFV